MHRSIPLLLLLSACGASMAGPWPSLAQRPGEIAPLVQRPTSVPAAVRPAVAATATGTTSDATGRLASIERDTVALAARLRTQISAMPAGKPAAGDAAADAELQLTRLDRLGGQIGALRERLDALAGDLARQAGAGDAASLLERTGKAIDEVEKLRTEQAASFAAARR